MWNLQIDRDLEFAEQLWKKIHGMESDVQSSGMLATSENLPLKPFGQEMERL